ncbi:hypothetical protein [Janthinobacterium sp. 17J80-10]|uniref:hypothetical protein n=1 Tax=Janthinobacterium sp. 17J80-10 TaxID=2497863 RepID=UPI0010054CE3|nr:hypothetical protein [Janthinobacterium sp. 17J80-10]QAU35000.1 hypothetical protein EKL02_12875 [Janthinobacterium sp. 17J80-10]
MRNWPQESKQALRLLAAARYFLPEALDCPADLERGYHTALRLGECPAALDALEQIGYLHSGHETEAHFWKELYYAAQQMGLPEHALRYQEQIRIISAMLRMQG